MNDLEQELKRLPRSAPPATLDVRVTATLQRPAPSLARPVPLWVCAAACVLCLAAGWTLRRPAEATPVSTAEPATTSTRVQLICRAEAASTLPASPFVGRRFAD